MQPGAEQAEISAEWVNKTVSWDKKVSQDRLIPQLSTGGEKKCHPFVFFNEASFDFYYCDSFVSRSLPTYLIRSNFVSNGMK